MLKYQLEFTEFPKFCQEIIGNLHGSNEFSDIALVGDDNRPFKAHQLVLRAHSNVIRDVLSSTDVEKPLLYLRGFNSHDIQCLLDFLYLGETSCEPKNVNVFLKTGKFLQIRQLVEECEDDLETLHEQFSLEVLDQFFDIIGDREVKAEEIKQMDISPLENEVEFHEEVGNKEKEIFEELQQFGGNENVQVETNKKKSSKDFIKTNRVEKKSKVTANYRNRIHDIIYKYSSRTRRPSGALTFGKEGLLHNATKHLGQFFYDHKEEMLRAVTQDLLLLHDVDPDVVLDALPASADGGGVIKNIFQNSVPPKLENQLDALNSNQCLNWLVPEMRTALGEEGKSNAYRLSWGNEAFRPSFWKGELERIAPWNLVESPTNHTNSIFGVPFVEVMKLAIRFRF